MTRTNVHWRAVLGVAAALAAALVLAAGPATAARHATAAAARACRTSSLVVWLNTEGSGAAGSSFYNLEFTNLGAASCTLTGYPGVSGVTLVGGQLGSAASRNPQHNAVAVTLAPRASAHVVLRIVDALNYPRSACAPVTAAGLRVYPPGQTASKVVPYPFLACSRSGSNYLSVEAAQPGQGGSS
jgi:Protein of unknown function (DUF4232)